jgi:hypothetical protein
MVGRACVVGMWIWFSSAMLELDGAIGVVSSCGCVGYQCIAHRG